MELEAADAGGAVGEVEGRGCGSFDARGRRRLRRMREVRCEVRSLTAAAAGGPIGGAECGCGGWGSSDGMVRAGGRPLREIGGEGAMPAIAGGGW